MTPQQTNQARELLRRGACMPEGAQMLRRMIHNATERPPLRQTTYTQQKAVWWGELIGACVGILILLALRQAHDRSRGAGADHHHAADHLPAGGRTVMSATNPMPPEIRKTLLRVIERARLDAVDELVRARNAFHRLTIKQRREQYDKSGESPQQILDELQTMRDHIACAEAWVESQP